MPALTRRRSDNPHQETWHVYYCDVHVGTIGERAGVPVHLDQWKWSCGFYPGCGPSERRDGTAPDFFTARRQFESAWRDLSEAKTEADYQAWRDDRDKKAEIRAKRARGEKLESEIPSSMMRCSCGIKFDSHVMAANLVHLPHISAARAEGKKW